MINFYLTTNCSQTINLLSQRKINTGLCSQLQDLILLSSNCSSKDAIRL